jgi:hypothetical protein
VVTEVAARSRSDARCRDRRRFQMEAQASVIRRAEVRDAPRGWGAGEARAFLYELGRASSGRPVGFCRKIKLAVGVRPHHALVLPVGTATGRQLRLAGCGVRQRKERQQEAQNEKQHSASHWPDAFGFCPKENHNKFAVFLMQPWSRREMLHSPEILPEK